MEGKGNPSKPYVIMEDVKSMMETRDMISKQLEGMSLGSVDIGAAAAVAASETSGGDYHANSITRLIADRRKILEEKKLIRRAQWKDSNNEEEVEERANFESVLPKLPDLAWEKVFEYITDPNDRRLLRNMTKQWRELMLNERTTLLFPLVLQVLFKKEFLKLEEAFHCRLVCQEWRRSFEKCLQEETNKIDVKRSAKWSTLTKYSPRFPSSREEQVLFLQMFPPDEEDSRNPFQVSRSLKLRPSNPHQPASIDVFESLQRMGVAEIDSLFLDFTFLRFPYQNLNVILEDQHQQSNLKHLGIITHEGRGTVSLHNGLRKNRNSPGLESLALYNVHRSVSDKFLKDHRDTLKTLVQHGMGMSKHLSIQRHGPFQKLKTLIYHLFGSDCPEEELFTHENDRQKNYVPSLEELEWVNVCTRNTDDVLKSFRFVNQIGRNSNIRTLRLGIWNNPLQRVAQFEIEEELLSSSLLLLNLPRLESLELSFQQIEVKNIDFILPCESLKEFTLTFFNETGACKRCKIFRKEVEARNNNNNGNKKKRKTPSTMMDGNEIIAFNGYVDRMYESNIWEILPDLRKLRISINKHIWREEKEMESKYYTRDGWI